MNTLSVPKWTATVDGTEYHLELATCERFQLGEEDHGLFTVTITFSGPTWGQSLAAHALDTYDPDLKRRIGTAFGMDYVMECVRILGSPSDRCNVRVAVLREEPYGLIVGFARLNDDGTIGDPFIPSILAARHFADVAS